MRVFGVGLNKTGTTSLSEACDQLGLRSFHHTGARLGPKEVDSRVERARLEGKSPFRYAARLRRYHAFFDVRVVEKHFDYIDRSLPGSKFILHTRDRDAWIASREKHVNYNLQMGYSTWTTIDPEGWVEEWESQHQRVHAHFADRPEDLLVMNISTGDGWPELCAFLGHPVPNTPFPRSNTARL